jgi:pyrimidine-nucleoside phosphorylase
VKAYRASKNGYISSMLSDKLGIAAMMLGAGRITKESPIDP